MATSTPHALLLLTLTLFSIHTAVTGEGACNVTAVESCLQTLYTAAESCSPQSLATLDTCFEENLTKNCSTSQTESLRENRTLSRARCDDPCAHLPQPPHVCGTRGTCSSPNNTWQIECTCAAGWTGDHCNDDVDECTAGTVDCGTNGTCTNTIGSHLCVCDAGYVWNTTTSSCQAFDKCESNSLGCAHECSTNMEGEDTCSCYPGYILVNGTECIQACETNYYGPNCTSVCDCDSEFLRCDSVTGCTECRTGLKGQLCNINVEIDTKCTPNTDCGTNGTCTNIVGGSFACYCDNGYVNRGGQPRQLCQEFNECIKDYDNNCDQTCHDVEEGYKCQCGGGYTLADDGTSCNDINECSNSTLNNCTGRAMCRNVPGNYTCTCPSGFELTESKLDCTDIDECTNETICVGNSTCLNNMGSYQCPCDTTKMKNDTLIMEINVPGNHEDPTNITSALKESLNGSQPVVSIVDDVDLYSCSFMAAASGSRRRLLQSDGLLRFVMVTRQGLTDVQRAQLALAVAGHLNGANLTVGGEQLTVSGTRVVVGGRAVVITDRCSYLNNLNFCQDGYMCYTDNNVAKCKLVPTPEAAGLSRLSMNVIIFSSVVVGLIFILLILAGVYICRKQQINNNYEKHKSPVPHGFDGSLRWSQADPRDGGNQAAMRRAHPYYKDSYNHGHPSYRHAPAMHSGTMRKWTGREGQGWSPTMPRHHNDRHQDRHYRDSREGRYEPKSYKYDREDDMSNLKMNQFQREENDLYNELRPDAKLSRETFYQAQGR